VVTELCAIGSRCDEFNCINNGVGKNIESVVFVYAAGPYFRSSVSMDVLRVYLDFATRNASLAMSFSDTRILGEFRSQ